MDAEMGGRVVVVGGGALGSLLAAKLSAGSAKVSILPSRSPEKCRVLAEQGIRVEGLSSVHAFVDVLCAPRALPADTSAVLLAIKDVGRGVEDVAARLASPNFVPDAAVVVSCMNGIRALGVLERHGLSTDRTAAMVSALGATLLDTGRVRHVGNGPSYLGTHSSSPRCDRLCCWESGWAASSTPPSRGLDGRGVNQRLPAVSPGLARPLRGSRRLCGPRASRWKCWGANRNWTALFGASSP